MLYSGLSVKSSWVVQVTDGHLTLLGFLERTKLSASKKDSITSCCRNFNNCVVCLFLHCSLPTLMSLNSIQLTQNFPSRVYQATSNLTTILNPTDIFELKEVSSKMIDIMQLSLISTPVRLPSLLFCLGIYILTHILLYYIKIISPYNLRRRPWSEMMHGITERKWFK